ncbi:MAG: hypothetical protein HDR24_11450 [Lachnospiraceae bacterium]|nr:hypothetical protein [Lachnospiraceae bacterium]
MSDEIRKPSFLVYYDNEVIVLRLSDDEAGRLFKSLFPYGREEIKPDFDDSPALAMAFDILSMAIDRDKEKYIRRCETNRENIEKRWVKTGKQSNTNVYASKQSNTNYTDKDMDKGNDKGNNKDNDMDNISTICPEPKDSALNPSGILLPLNDKSFYDVPLDKIALWKEAYPVVDVDQELKRIIAWLDSNPTRRKTRRGIERFINRWLAREQDEGGTYKNREYNQKADVEAALAKHRSNIDPPECPDGPFQ